MGLIIIQTELKAPKGQYNSFGKYNYRNCEDILEALKPLLAKYSCTLTLSDSIKEVGGRIYVEATATFKDVDGNVVVNKAYARESETKKGMDESQITGAASSYARKYALNGLFLIDDTKDADFYEPEKPKKAEPKKPEAYKKEDFTQPTKKVKCESCGAETPQNVIERSQKAFGKNLCIPCGVKESEKEKR